MGDKAAHAGQGGSVPLTDFSDARNWSQPQYYATIQLADIDGNGQAELLGRGANGIVIYRYDTQSEAWTVQVKR